MRGGARPKAVGHTRPDQFPSQTLEIDLEALILPLGVLMLMALSLYSNVKSGRRYVRGRRFDDYRREHPDSVVKGRALCSKCGDGYIFMRAVFRSITEIHNSHVCRTCGTELYRSLTPIWIRTASPTSASRMEPTVRLRGAPDRARALRVAKVI